MRVTATLAFPATRVGRHSARLWVRYFDEEGFPVVNEQRCVGHVAVIGTRLDGLRVDISRFLENIRAIGPQLPRRPELAVFSGVETAFKPGWSHPYAFVTRSATSRKQASLWAAHMILVIHSSAKSSSSAATNATAGAAGTTLRTAICSSRARIIGVESL